MFRLAIVLISLLFIASDTPANETMIVTATAYNAVPGQTTPKHSDITAWGDKLKPGMKCIAVSRDLIALGLDYNTEVTIEGFDGVYLVKDKMHRRWQERIDIYMGDDIHAAMAWGVRKVEITWDNH